MSNINQTTKQHRDWLNAWTILVMPSLLWFVIIYVFAGPFGSLHHSKFLNLEWLGNVVMTPVLVFSPFICVVWAVLHFLFVKKVNSGIRYIQIIINALLSLVYPSIAIGLIQLMEGYF